MEGSETRFLIKRGRLLAHGVKLSDRGTIVAFSVPVGAWDTPEAHGLRPMLHKGAIYPAERAAATLLKIGEHMGITQSALELLNSVPRNKEQHELGRETTPAV